MEFTEDINSLTPHLEIPVDEPKSGLPSVRCLIPNSNSTFSRGIRIFFSLSGEFHNIKIYEKSSFSGSLSTYRTYNFGQGLRHTLK